MESFSMSIIQTDERNAYQDSLMFIAIFKFRDYDDDRRKEWAIDVGCCTMPT